MKMVIKVIQVRLVKKDSKVILVCKDLQVPQASKAPRDQWALLDHQVKLDQRDHKVFQAPKVMKDQEDPQGYQVFPVFKVCLDLKEAKVILEIQDREDPRDHQDHKALQAPQVHKEKLELPDPQVQRAQEVPRETLAYQV